MTSVCTTLFDPESSKSENMRVLDHIIPMTAKKTLAYALRDDKHHQRVKKMISRKRYSLPVLEAEQRENPLTTVFLPKKKNQELEKNNTVKENYTTSRSNSQEEEKKGKEECIRCFRNNIRIQLFEEEIEQLREELHDERVMVQFLEDQRDQLISVLANITIGSGHGNTFSPNSPGVSQHESVSGKSAASARRSCRSLDRRINSVATNGNPFAGDDKFFRNSEWREERLKARDEAAANPAIAEQQEVKKKKRFKKMVKKVLQSKKSKE